MIEIIEPSCLIIPTYSYQRIIPSEHKFIELTKREKIKSLVNRIAHGIVTVLLWMLMAFCFGTGYYLLMSYL